ncbi:MAG: Lrp/AsnC family transcriptional regulator [Emcibacter sp.]|nr:Lrp/AsnC family transcriptional regulator [Emcibacter sp.]
MSISTLDRIDRNILTVLQADNRIYNQVLADRVAVSAPTCLRRVRRLRKLGFIQKDVSILNSKMLGSLSFFIVHLELHEENTHMMAQLEDGFKMIDSVMQCYLVTGEWDYTLFICTHSISEFHKFIDTHIYTNPSIKKFMTQTILKEVKHSTALPIMSI